MIRCAVSLLIILVSSFDATTSRLRAEDRSAQSSMLHKLGPLRAHPDNPRYFTDGSKLADGSLRVVYLTGSHTWANLIDRGSSDPPPTFDYDGYLDLLDKYHHNFIRLWGRQTCWYEKYGEQPLHAVPLAWQRTGPGLALDGKPKFDLAQLDPAYFERLRARVEAARKREIYVSIMLFGGYKEVAPNWTGSPFHRDNNVNGIDGDRNQDGSGLEIETLSEIPKSIADIQKQYIRKVIETVNDLDNVLFEIANEGGVTSKDWQYDLIRFVKEYEHSKPFQHPVGMTAGYWLADENRGILNASPADWVSYLFDINPAPGQSSITVDDPFIADGSKVSIQDSDHWWVVPLYGNVQFGRAWVWKSFCRGHNPILMEHLPPRSFVNPDEPLSLDDPGYVASRTAMGQTRRYAERINLAAMMPSKDIASTTYCLANPGREYLVYLPTGGTVTMDLSMAKHALSVEWFEPSSETAIASGTIEGGGQRTLTSPFSGDAVLYLSVPR